MSSYRSFGMFGLILLAFGILGGLTGGAWNSVYVLVHIIGGLSMLALYLFTHIENLRESVTGRRTQYATNTAVYTVLFLFAIGLVNFMAARNEWRYDATEQGIFSLAPQTRSLLDGLEEEVEILAFFREGEGMAIESLLDTYAAASDRFAFTMIDPDRRPELTQQHEVTQYGTLVATIGDDSTRITESTEEALTNALIRLSGAESKRVYFTAGHEEPDLTAAETPDGFGQLRSAIENEGAEVTSLSLATVPDVPGDADLLVIGGPRRTFLDNELAALERYLDRGGRALFLIEPQQSPELVSLLAERGVAVGNDVIIDQQVQLFAGPSVGVEPVVRDYGVHAITEGFGQDTLFRLARSVRTAEETPPGVSVTELAMTSGASWAETDLEQLFADGRVDPAGDDPGPISVAVATTLASEALSWTAPAIATAPEVPGDGTAEEPGDAANPLDEGAGDEAGEAATGEEAAMTATGDEAAGSTAVDEEAAAAPGGETAEEDTAGTAQQTTAGDPPADLEGRVVVVGDAEWVNNSRLTLMFNEDLALNMVSWLTGGDAETIAIRPRTRRASRVSLTEAQGWRVFYATVLLLPELVLLCGLTIWWRRRR